ncbi:MAG: hypothetical protein MJ189_01885 [Coriobacteriales bacterium]|nr:hypothetical protein [Coriobacteriales bacterium]
MHIKVNKIARVIFIALVLLACIFFQIVIWNYSQGIDNLKKSQVELSNNIDSIGESLLIDENNSGAYQKMLDADDVHEYVIKIREKLDSVNFDYSDKSQIKNVETIVDNILDPSNPFDPTPLTLLAVQLGIENDNLENLVANKEDKDNKVDVLSDDLEGDEYLSSDGVLTEFKKFFDDLYPVGSIYISLSGQMPSYGSWTKLESGRVLWSDDTGNGSLLGATLPNVRSGFDYQGGPTGQCAGAYPRDFGANGAFNRFGGAMKFRRSGSFREYYSKYMDFNHYNSIYQTGATVKPPSIAVTMFKRTA